MADIRISFDDERVRNALNKLMRDIPKIVERPMMVVAQTIAGISQEHYLRGPKPDRLAVATGNLRKSISSKVEVKGEEVIGYVGTNVVSPGGFNYPAYWEFHGHKGKPRPFLTPARENHRDKWWGVFVKELKKEMREYLNRLNKGMG